MAHKAICYHCIMQERDPRSAVYNIENLCDSSVFPGALICIDCYDNEAEGLVNSKDGDARRAVEIAGELEKELNFLS